MTALKGRVDESATKKITSFQERERERERESSREQDKRNINEID